jgi:hypothetical protein
MTQELNKDALEATMAAFYDRPRKFIDSVQVQKAIQAYINHTKATGFEERISDVCVLLQKDPLPIIVVDLIRDMQAALAGGTTKVTGFDIGLMKDAIDALEDLGACPDDDCIVSGCNRVLPRLKAALAAKGR